MSDIAISSRNLSKSFKIDHERDRRVGYRTLHDDLVDLPSRLWAGLKRKRTTSETFCALKNITFEVRKGEMLGIIGRNGAGKSTLLKILCRITKPTSGTADIYGRIGTLLEVGTGFHPELTGRENIFMNGVILGMSRAEVRKRFDEIVEFSEVEKFLDTPVKHYSSGMHVRLAFAVAAHLDPEILLVDEVLAVGDAKFQKKCTGKMEDIAKTGDRTVIFVSHNLGAIVRLCPNSMWLDSGSLRNMGSSSRIVAEYLTSEARRGEVTWSTGAANHGAGHEFKFLGVRVRNSDGAIAATLENAKPFSIEIDFLIAKPLSDVRVGFSIVTSDGLCLFDAYDDDFSEFCPTRMPGRYTSCCHIPQHLLNPSTYLISVNAGIPGIKNFAHIEHALMIDIEDTSGRLSIAGREGIIQPKLRWTQKTDEIPEISSVR